jgi:hypothetical protein
MSRRWAASYGVIDLLLLGGGAVPTWVAPFLLPGFRPLREGQWASLVTLLVPYAALMAWLMLPYAIAGIAVVYGISRRTLRHAGWITLGVACATITAVGGTAIAATVSAPHRATAGAIALAILPILQTVAAACLGGLVWLLLLGLRFATRRIGQRPAGHGA